MTSGEIGMVCFDAGGVLVRICRTWREGCDRAGVGFRELPDENDAASHRAALTDRFQRGEVTPDQFFEGIAATTRASHSAEEVRAVHDAWIIEEYAGVGSIIDRLNGAPGVQTGLLSNTNASHWRHPLMMGSESTIARLAHPHASHLLGHVKPDLDIYRAFERETGVSGAKILFFDDLLENVESARAAGWHAEQIDHAADTASQIQITLRDRLVIS